MYQTKKEQDNVVLVGLDDLSELCALAVSANCVVVSELTQARTVPHPKTYLGTGKIEELQAVIEATQANGIITDDELTPSQLKHLTNLLNVKVMDRTMLILDIFANNATSAEAIAQVEIAQQRYNLTRLTGMGINMSRLGGGIGTRGPGEKKLETDRRAIRARITELEKELVAIETHRNNLRKGRIKEEKHMLSLVGYTNAGKSTVMNALTNAGVLSQNMVFSTLDTTTRKLYDNILITDTVGFIQKLPTTLVRAFRSTLEELQYATALLHVIDVSNPNYKTQMDTVYTTLDQLECGDIPVIAVFNKMDKAAQPTYPKDTRAATTVSISAKTGQNIEELKKAIDQTLADITTKISLFLPHAHSHLLGGLYRQDANLVSEYTQDGINVTAKVPKKYVSKVREFLVDGGLVRV